MIKPRRLKTGDKVATISLSWGGPAELPFRYQAGKRQLQETFGLEVVETKHALKPNDWIYRNPAARADDLMTALEDPSIKAIISTIGGEESMRTLPYIDYEIIKNNPKIFLGFSDSTVTHFCFYKAGVTSFYGTSILCGFAENGGMNPYQINDLQKSLFSSEIPGKIAPNPDGWHSARWAPEEKQEVPVKLQATRGWRFLQGDSIVEGQLLGGCVEVLEFIKDTPCWVAPEDWKGKIMFLETSEVKMEPVSLCWKLRNYAASGILKNINGLIVGRPHSDKHWKEYDEVLLKVIRDEEGLGHLPIVTGMDFGHTNPAFTLPYGIQAQIDCVGQTFSIVESATV